MEWALHLQTLSGRGAVFPKMEIKALPELGHRRNVKRSRQRDSAEVAVKAIGNRLGLLLLFNMSSRILRGHCRCDS